MNPAMLPLVIAGGGKSMYNNHLQGKTSLAEERNAMSESRSDIQSAPCVIGRASAQDEDAIYALYHSLIGAPYGTWSEEYPDREQVREDLLHSEVFVMRAQGRVIAAIVNEDSDEFDGMAPWYADVKHWAQLGRLGVDSAWQGRGVGRAMVRHALACARAEGCDAARLLVGVHNLPAKRIYDALGFEGCGEADAWGNRWLCCQKRL